jgi:hypothetical protein
LLVMDVPDEENDRHHESNKFKADEMASGTEGPSLLALSPTSQEKSKGNPKNSFS